MNASFSRSNPALITQRCQRPYYSIHWLLSEATRREVVCGFADEILCGLRDDVQGILGNLYSISMTLVTLIGRTGNRRGMSFYSGRPINGYITDFKPVPAVACLPAAGESLNPYTATSSCSVTTRTYLMECEFASTLHSHEGESQAFPECKTFHRLSP
jgi:hypothetical protein